MIISSYQKWFGVGPSGLLIGLVLFGLLWLLDNSFGHVEIMKRPGPVRAAGFGLIAVWLCWHFWCIRTIRQWWVHDQLCTTGPYRYVRHPIYAGGILLATLGVCLVFNSWIMLLLPAILFPINSLLVRKEETMMAAVFGEEYQRYAAKTGQLFPRIFG